MLHLHYLFEKPLCKKPLHKETYLKNLFDRKILFWEHSIASFVANISLQEASLQEASLQEASLQEAS